jgi:Big-like domain-containing protein
MRVVAGGVVLASVALACSDAAMQSDGETPLPPSPFVVSNPVPGPALSAARGALARSAAGTSSSVTSTASLVYVSLSPGAIPGASSASILDQRTSSNVTVAVVDGGFDPVALTAAAGDTLDVLVQSGTIQSGSYRLPVHLIVSPTVVRTNPPGNKRDVSLNPSIQVVFSEPMDSASLAGAVTLTDGGVPVPGSVVIPPNGGDILQVTFVPDVPLAPLTTYVLQVGTGARDRDGEALGTPVQSQFTTNALAPDLIAPVVSIISPVSGDSQAADYPSLRIAVAEDHEIIETSWLFKDASGGPPVGSDIFTVGGEDGRSAETQDALLNMWYPIAPGTYTVRVTAVDGAENAGSSAPVTVTFVTPDTQPRIVVRAFSVVEFEDPPGSKQWLYAPQVVVADAPGQDGLQMVGFEMLTIPGLVPPNVTRRLWARSLTVPPGQDIPLFHELYGDYGAAFGGVGSGGSRRSSGGQATARLTYRDDTGHYYATTIQGPIVPGTRPGTYTGGCGHWFDAGKWPGDLSYCGWSSDSRRLGDGYTVTTDVPAK